MSEATTLPVRAAIVPVTPFQQNCTIIWSTTTKTGAVVDPGGDVERIQQGIAQSDVRIDKILLTHGHIDHAGGAAELAEILGIPVIGPQRDDDWLLKGLPAQGAQYGLPGVREVMPDRWLEEGDSVEVGDVSFEVLHCPGHTPGHVIFINKKIGFGLVGDVLFQGSVGRTDLPGGDWNVLAETLRKLLDELPDETTVYPGHMGITTIGAERATNPFVAELAR
jgi:hydroxyacylglutathione hydrolase